MNHWLSGEVWLAWRWVGVTRLRYRGNAVTATTLHTHYSKFHLKWLKCRLNKSPIDGLTVKERERSTERERDRVIGERWMKESSGQVHVHEVTARQWYVVKNPEALRFLILLATTVMNTGGDKRWHTIKVKVHPLVVSLLSARSACRHSFFHCSRFLPGCFSAPCYKVNFLLSVLIFSFCSKNHETATHKWAGFTRCKTRHCFDYNCVGLVGYQANENPCWAKKRDFFNAINIATISICRAWIPVTFVLSWL